MEAFVAGDVDRLAGGAPHMQELGGIGIRLSEQEFGRGHAKTLLVDVDGNLLVAVDDVVEREQHHARVVRLLDDSAEGRGVVGVDDDGVEALIDEVVGRRDLRRDILADRDDLELLDVLRDFWLLGVGLGHRDHLHAPVIGDESVDKGDPVGAGLRRPLEVLGSRPTAA